MTDKATLERPSHDPLPIEKCPHCLYESPHHKEAGWVMRNPRETTPFYLCCNETCGEMFEGMITKEEMNANLL